MILFSAGNYRMKKLFLLTLLFIAVCARAQVEKVIPPRPNPPRLVNDFTRLLTHEQNEALEEKLKVYNDSTSTQIAIVIVDGLQGYEAADYAVELGRKWGVGGKEFSNGVVILISTGGGEGNRDVFIATGYGLEGAIPDVTAKSIVENDIIPNFRAGNYYRGLDAAVNDIIKAAAGEYKAPAGYKGRQSGARKGIGFGAVLVILIIAFSLLGGGGRGRGGGMVSRRGYGDLATGWIIGSLLSGAGKGRSGGGWSGGGGGGGFGGFGGGGFGGGGAGGKW